MIPALLAVPMVQNLVGGVVGGVVNAFAPSTPPPSTPTTFAASLNRAAAPGTSAPSMAASGVLRADQWAHMNPTAVQSWAKGLIGRHVDATDASGRTVSGLVSALQPAGNSLSLNVGGHLIALSNLKQISWASSAV